MDYEAREELNGKQKEFGIQGNLEADNIDEVCAELFYRFIDAMASNKGYIDTTLPVHIDSYGNRYVTVEVSTVYVKDGKLHVGDEVLELPTALAPEKDIKPEEMPYVNALCAAMQMRLPKQSLQMLLERCWGDIVEISLHKGHLIMRQNGCIIL